MTFTNPYALLLLLLIPIFILIMWPRRNPRHTFRETLSLILRSVIVFLLVLVLAGISQVQETDKLSTIFLLDVSDSLGGTGRDTGLTYIREALGQMTPDDEAGLVVFGGDALVERPVSNRTTLGELTSIPTRSHTDIAGAIRLGLTLFPDDAARRMVLISDGEANQGDARQAAQLAQANNVELSVVSIAKANDADVRIDSLTSPALLHEDENFDLTVQIHSDRPQQVPLQVFSEGELIAQQNLTVQPGENSFVLPLIAGRTGFTTFQARLTPGDDAFPQNNAVDAFSEITGPISVLLVANEPDEGQAVAQALRGAGLVVDEIAPAEMASDLGGLSNYKAIVLVNVPAAKLSPRRLDVLQTYVRDLGHGLVVIGGEESYGPGGYFQTALEETLPVEMVIQDKQRLPGMTLMMVIDKSGSMESSGTDQFGWGIPRKVELAKEAIYRSIDLLVPWDRIGVIAFDSAAQWVVEPVSAADVNAIKNAVGTIRASGGTDILAGLQLAELAILKESTQVRHIVLLTDGGANPFGIPELVENLFDQGVTVSVVAIGEDYAPFLEDVAEMGGGRFHFAKDPSTIPQIFAQETSLASRSYIVEETFAPQVAGPSSILQGLTTVPNLEGYVATSPKLTAQLILQGGSEQDPLLAQWQYGLGRSVAWTSDAKGQWAAEWINWPDFPRFWSQAVRWTIVEGTGGALETQVRLEEGRAIVSAEVLQGNGQYLNDLEVTLSLIAPDLSQQQLTLPQVAPGLYEGEFQPDQIGAYLLHIIGQKDEGLLAAQTRGFVMTYSPEYRPDDIDPNLLPDIATIGGGQMLSLDNPAAAFVHTLPPARGVTPIWPGFLIAALVLLPLDVGIRRVIFGRAEIKQLWRRVRSVLPQRSQAPSAAPAPSRASHLLKVKDRTEQKRPEHVTPPITPKPSQPEPEIDIPPPPPPPPMTPVPDVDASSEAPDQPAQETNEESEERQTVRRLMEAKKRRKR